MNRTLIFSFLLLLAFACPALADPPPHARPGGPRENGRREPDAHDTARLIHATITALTARNLAVEAGFTGCSPLPPGIAKNLARGKPLPPGIAKKLAPGGMLRRLPDYPDYEWRVMGTDLVLINLSSMLIADILHDVFK